MGSSLSSEAAWARRWFLGIGTSFFVGGACLDPKEDHIPGQAGFAVLEKKAIEETRDGGLKPGDHFYYAEEFNLSWMPTLKAVWGPRGQQVMIPTPAQPKKRYGIGAVDYHTGLPHWQDGRSGPPSQTQARDRRAARSAVGEAPDWESLCGLGQFQHPRR